MSLSIQQVEHLAKLAKIELSREEREKYANELSAILDYVKKLEEVPKSKSKKNQESLVSANDEEASRLRQDAVIGASTAEIEALLKEVPNKQERLIKAKAVFE